MSKLKLLDSVNLNLLEHKLTWEDLIEDIQNLRNINQLLREENLLLSQNKHTLYEAILQEKDETIKSYENRLKIDLKKNKNKNKKPLIIFSFYNELIIIFLLIGLIIGVIIGKKINC